MTRDRILFVDDDPQILSGLQKAFRRDRERWDIVVAVGPEAAIETLAGGVFSMIVSDMRMPKIDGITLLNHVKVHYPSMVRVILSGSADCQGVASASDAVDELLVKPCDTPTLRAAIERLLPMSRARLVG